MTGLAKPCMSIHPMASPTVCLVSIEVNSLTVTSDCSCLVIIKRFRFYRNLLLFFEFRYYPLLLLLKDSDFIGIFYCFSNFGTVLIIIIIIILFFPDTRLSSQISKTASHSATKLHSYMDPYPTHCSARFGVDPDYRSGSRARSVFSDFPQYLRN